jgi:hypothetical protein
MDSGLVLIKSSLTRQTAFRKREPMPPIPFPQLKSVPATTEEKKLIYETQAEIHELLQEVGGGLQEIRHHVIGQITDILQEGNFSEIKLIRLLNAQPSVIREITGKSDEEMDVESLPTETLDGYLRILRKEMEPDAGGPEESATHDLLGMKQAVCKVFGESVARLGLDEWTLVEMLDERPSVIRELMAKKAPSLATEAILEHLDNLRTQLTQRS